MSCRSNIDFTILSVNSEAQWRARQIDADHLLIGKDGLTLRNFSEYAFARVIGKPEGVIEPTDLAVDRCGTLFILDGRQSRVAMYDPRQDRLEWIECIGGVGDLPTQLNAPQAIAVTDRTLYIADTGNHRVIAFARMNWQVRWIVEGAAPPGSPPEEFASPPELPLPMEPCDLAVDADENLYVLDCDSLLVQKFDRGGRLIDIIGQGWLIHPVTIAIDNTSRGDIACLLLHIRTERDRRRHAETIVQLLANAYHKLSEREQEDFVEALAALATGALEEQLQFLRSQLQQGMPGAIEIVETQLAPLIAKYQTLLYVLDAAFKQALKFNGDGEFFGVTIDLNHSGLGFLDPFGLALDQQGDIYLGDRRPLAQGEDEDRFIYKFDAAGNFLGPPITAYRGRTDGLVMDQKFNLYVLNRERKEVTILKRQEKFLPKGVYLSTAFDSASPDCEWHKLVIDAAITEKTQIKISYFISETPKSDAEIVSLSDNEWSKPLLNPQDALILGPTGRYLWLRIEMAGDGQASPVVHSARVYFQRTSYLRYLPAVYQEDAASRDFLERFLSLFESQFYNLEVGIGQIARLFDPLATREAFLPWLAQWLAAAFDENWPPEKQRQFLSQAATLYKARGTRRGFEKMIELFTDEKPIIFEFFQLRCVQDGELRGVYERLFGKDPFHFCVLLKPAQVRTEGEYLAVKRIVEADKPAHTHAGVRPLEPWIYLDMHTYLEINTYLLKPEMRLEQQSVIGRDSVLTDVSEAGQVERRSRVNIDTVLT